MSDLPRKLTDEQLNKLRSLLRAELKHANSLASSQPNEGDEDGGDDDDDDDVSDLLDYALAMVSNGKTVAYIVSELASMEMDICTKDAAERIGVGTRTFLRVISIASEAHKVEDSNSNVVVDSDTVVVALPGTTDDPVTISKVPPKSDVKKMVTIKSKVDNNALTKAGALGSLRPGDKKIDDSSKKKSENAPSQKSQRATHDRTATVSNNSLADKKNMRRQGHQRQKNDKLRRNQNKKERGGAGGRSIAAEAFRRLAQQRDHERPARRSFGRNSGDRILDDRRKQSGRNDYSGRTGRMGRGDGSRGRAQRHIGAGLERLSGQKRRNHFFANDKIGGVDRVHGRSGCGNRASRVGDIGSQGSGLGSENAARERWTGRDAGRMVSDNGPNKVVRHSNNQDQHHRVGNQARDSMNGNLMCNNETERPSQRDFSRRREGYRGRRGGRGVHTFRPNTTQRNNGATTENMHSKEGVAEIHAAEELTLAAAAVSPSPLVEAQFRHQIGYSGRGYAFRGGRGFRGRGRGGPGRAEVAAMIASKSWSRSKTTVTEGQSAAQT